MSYRQIHHVQTGYRDRWVLDADEGAVKRREMVMRHSDVHRIAHEGKTYDVHDDGTFHVPDAVAAHMLRMPGWHEGESPFYDDTRPTPDDIEGPRVTRRR